MSDILSAFYWVMESVFGNPEEARFYLSPFVALFTYLPLALKTGQNARADRNDVTSVLLVSVASALLMLVVAMATHIISLERVPPAAGAPLIVTTTAFFIFIVPIHSAFHRRKYAVMVLVLVGRVLATVMVVFLVNMGLDAFQGTVSHVDRAADTMQGRDREIDVTPTRGR